MRRREAREHHVRRHFVGQMYITLNEIARMPLSFQRRTQGGGGGGGSGGSGPPPPPPPPIPRDVYSYPSLRALIVISGAHGHKEYFVDTLVFFKTNEG